MSEIKYGVFEIHPARFTDDEAWVLIDDVWRSFPPGEVLMHTASIPQAEFIAAFGHLPDLPATAFQSAS